MVPKPGKPGRFRLVQNLSHPHTPQGPISSINHNIDSDLYPLTWGTFTTICTTIWSLPPGSQGAVRDIAEAYRSIPIAADQWPGLVVQLEADTNACFGCASSSGNFGHVGDAGADIFCANGIGPLSKWVNDHIFFQIPRTFLKQYNWLQEHNQQCIADAGGVRQDGGHIWFKGQDFPDGSFNEFDEDFQFPIQDLSSSTPQTSDNVLFTYGFKDIDNISMALGLIWETSKDIPFTTRPVFIGLEWDIEAWSVSLPQCKHKKYLAAIHDWQQQRKHVLEDMQKLHGKLLHASLAIPHGCTYITKLEAMIPIFGNQPFKPRIPPTVLALTLIGGQLA